MSEFSLIAAALVGLLGGVHCLGMCGGIVSALAFSLPENKQGGAAAFPYLLLYNFGRMVSYTLAGAVAGSVGSLLTGVLPLEFARFLLLLVAALFMLAMGMYLGGWWMGLTKIEKAGGYVWRYLEPLGRKVLPVRAKKQAFTLGLVWGWLPCGLVYSVLILATAAGSGLGGALLMLAFAVGTLPNLMLMGGAAGWLQSYSKKPVIRHIAGGLVFGYGLFMLAGLVVAKL